MGTGGRSPRAERRSCSSPAVMDEDIEPEPRSGAVESSHMASAPEVRSNFTFQSSLSSASVPVRSFFFMPDTWAP